MATSTLPPRGDPGASRRFRRLVLAALREPLHAHTWREFAYAILGLPLAVAAVVGTVVPLLACFFTSVSVVGLPLVTLVLGLIRAIGRLHRRLARMMLGHRIEPPPPPPTARGVMVWLQVRLTDPVAWRALAYLLLKVPLAALEFVIAVGCWVYGFLAFTFPAQFALDWNQETRSGPHGPVREGLVIASVDIHTVPGMALVAVIGLLLILAGPWLLRPPQRLDRMLSTALLGPSATAARLRRLERGRAHAVADSVATVRRVERDLHDGAQARLVALGMHLARAGDELVDDENGPVDVERARRLVDEARQDVTVAIAELRDLVRGIHPPVLDRGLDSALATLAAGSGVPVALDVELPTRPSQTIETIAYFCAAELLTNVNRHSDARHAALRAAGRGRWLTLDVGDDGTGGAVAEAGGGLAGLVERVRTVDGTLAVDSPPGGPTTVTVRLPYDPAS